MSKLAWVVMYWLSRAGLLLPRRWIPTSVGYAVATRLADVAFFLLRGPRRTLLANLTPILGDPEAARRAAKESFRNFGRYVVDLFQLPVLGRDAVRSRVSFDNWSVLTDGRDSRGTIFVTLHLGQWEMGAAALAACDYPVSVIAQTLGYKPMNDLVQGFRRSLGMRIIPGEKAVPQMFRCLARNEMLGLLIDVVEPGEGVSVNFFEAPAEMSTLPARIALKTGARVVSAVLGRDPREPTRLRPVVDSNFLFEPSGNEEADIAGLTQAIATSLESLVRCFPDQWFAFRPVWQTPPKLSAPPTGRKVDWNARRNLIALSLANTIFARLPRSVNYRIGEAVADAAFKLRKGMRADVMDNMRHVFGPLAPEARIEAAAREAVRNVCRYYADLIRFPHTSGKKILEEITIRGFDKLTGPLATGRGTVVATAHFGNPEIAVQVAKELGLDLLVLSETLRPPEFSDLVHRLRGANGIEYAEVGFHNIGRALAHLRGGGCLAITCDRDIQANGAVLPFFGANTRLPLGAVELAARTGAALVPAYCRRTGAAFEVVFEEPIDLVRTSSPKLDAMENAERLLQRIEAWIRSDPGQWMVLERVWRPVPEPNPELPGPSRQTDRQLAEV